MAMCPLCPPSNFFLLCWSYPVSQLHFLHWLLGILLATPSPLVPHSLVDLLSPQAQNPYQLHHGLPPIWLHLRLLSPRIRCGLSGLQLNLVLQLYHPFNLTIVLTPSGSNSALYSSGVILMLILPFICSNICLFFTNIY